MSIITAILNAILQAIGWLMPISESGHSSIYHDFSSNSFGNFWMVTGFVHIGIAIGIFLASFSLFKRLSIELFRTGKELVHKEFKPKEAKGARYFLYMVILSFVPMLLWVIPLGKNGNLYSLLRSLSFNGTVLDEGIFIAFTGLLLFLAVRQLTLSRNDKDISVITALVVGLASVIFVPTAGMSFIGGVFSILIIFGITKKQAYNFPIVMSVPILIVTGIVEAVLAQYRAGIVEIIIGLVLSTVMSFICTRVLKFIISKNYLIYFSYYDFGLGGLCAIIGLIQLIVRK